MKELGRREFLLVAAGAAAVVAASPKPVFAATDNGAAAAEAKFLGGATPKTAGLTLDMPEIAENGNTVPLLVSLDEEATPERYAESVLLLADGNPTSNVVTFHFTPMSGRMEASTRMRLAQTQNIIAIAKMNDGSFLRTERLVKVTIGGCGG